MAEQRIVNEINVSEWFAIIEKIKSQPDLAKSRLRAHNRWVGGTHCRTFIHDFYGAGQERTHAESFTLEADEPALLLGRDQGPSATEAHLYALASCLNTSFMYHASAHRVRVEELELELEGDMDLQGVMGLSAQVRNGFQEIRVTFRVKADAPREKIEQLCELAQKRSPVFDITTHPTPVSVRLETM
jgi:uncharacterized OsmC-like protein